VESHADPSYLAPVTVAASSGRRCGATLSVRTLMDWSQSTLQTGFLNGAFWAYYRTPLLSEIWLRWTTRCGVAGTFSVDRSILCRPPIPARPAALAADIAIGTGLIRYFKSISRGALPNVERWYSALQSRPAYREHVMVPFEECVGDWLTELAHERRMDPNHSALTPISSVISCVAEQHHGVVAVEQRVAIPA